MYEITKEFTICCAHRLNNKFLDRAKNKKLFGKCNNPSYHGHNYKIILYLCREELTTATDMVMNFYDIKRIFNEVIDKRFDHTCLNDDILFKVTIPTAEKMCKVFYDLLKPKLMFLYKIQIYETDGASASYGE